MLFTEEEYGEPMPPFQLRGREGLELLEAAVATPRHPYLRTKHEKAPALFRSLIKNHPLIDGNERLAVMALVVFLNINRVDFKVTPTDMVDTALAVAAYPGTSRSGHSLSGFVGTASDVQRRSSRRSRRTGRTGEGPRGHCWESTAVATRAPVVLVIPTRARRSPRPSPPRRTSAASSPPPREPASRAASRRGCPSRARVRRTTRD